jgi:hypothetical protein
MFPARPCSQACAGPHGDAAKGPPKSISRSRSALLWFESYWGLDEFVRSGVDDGVAIDVLDAEHDTFLELLLRRDPDVVQDRASD